MNRKLKTKVQLQDIEEKPYLNPERMNRETYEILSTKMMRSRPTIKKMLDKVSQDSRVISLLQIQDDGITGKATSALRSKWGLLQDQGDKRQLNQYVRFLLGVQQPQPSKKGISLRAKNMLAKVKEQRQREADAQVLEVGQRDKTYQEKFDQYVAEEQDVMKQVAEHLEDKVHDLSLIHI